MSVEDSISNNTWNVKSTASDFDSILWEIVDICAHESHGKLWLAIQMWIECLCNTSWLNNIEMQPDWRQINVHMAFIINKNTHFTRCGLIANIAAERYFFFFLSFTNRSIISYAVINQSVDLSKYQIVVYTWRPGYLLAYLWVNIWNPTTIKRLAYVNWEGGYVHDGSMMIDEWDNCAMECELVELCVFDMQPALFLRAYARLRESFWLGIEL